MSTRRINDLVVYALTLVAWGAPFTVLIVRTVENYDDMDHWIELWRALGFSLGIAALATFLAWLIGPRLKTGIPVYLQNNMGGLALLAVVLFGGTSIFIFMQVPEIWVILYLIFSVMIIVLYMYGSFSWTLSRVFYFCAVWFWAWLIAFWILFTEWLGTNELIELIGFEGFLPDIPIGNDLVLRGDRLDVGFHTGGGLMALILLAHVWRGHAFRSSTTILALVLASGGLGALTLTVSALVWVPDYIPDGMFSVPSQGMTHSVYSVLSIFVCVVFFWLERCQTRIDAK